MRIFFNLIFLFICCCGISQTTTIHLTFDDGPDDVWTQAVLDTLSKYDVKASFLFCGMNIPNRENIVVRAYREGHRVGNHSELHETFYNTIDGYELLQDKIMPAHKRLSMLSVQSHYYRPPQAKKTAQQIQYLENKGYLFMDVYLDSFDWQMGITIQQVFNNVVSSIVAGQYNNILMHTTIANDLTRSMHATAGALPLIINYCNQNGYEFTTSH